MTGPRDPDTLRAAERIMRYLRDHVDAADTADGIATWWLNGSPFAPTTVERALKQLVAEGHVESVLVPDGRIVFRAPRSDQNAGSGGSID